MTVSAVVRTTVFAPLIIFFSLLCGCGGGGGSATQSGTVVDPASSYQGITRQASVTPDNAKNLINGGFDGGAYGGIVSELSSTLSTAILDNLGGATPSGTFQVQGDDGGSATITLQVNQTTGSFSGRVTLVDFTFQNSTANGSCNLSGTIESRPVLNDAKEIVTVDKVVSQMTLSFGALSMEMFGDSYLLVGSATLNCAYTFHDDINPHTPPNLTSDTLNLNMVLKDSSAKSYWFNNYRIVTVNGISTFSQIISGRYYDPAQGYLDVSTLIGLGGSFGRNLPYQGTLLGYGANGTWIRMNYQPAAFSIDANYNGPSVWHNDFYNTHDAVAQAGNDQSVKQGSTVTLAGSASSNPSGNTLSYSWTFESYPAGTTTLTLTGADTATPSFVVDKAGTYILSFTVDDGNAKSAPDSVVVVSNPWLVARAGANKEVVQGTTVSLDGSTSNPINAQTPLTTYTWDFDSYPGTVLPTLTTTDPAKPTFVADQIGTYVLSLTVSDGTNVSLPSTVSVVVTPAVP